jgi:twinkle protein
MQTYSTCPKCSDERRKSNKKCLSSNGEVFFCHHCGYSGRHKEGNSNYFSEKERTVVKTYRTIDQEIPSTESLSDDANEFFEKRQITKEALKRNKICFKNNEIMFPYFKDGEIVNIKYRTLNKEYRQEKDAEKVFYGLDDIKGEDTIIIVEGEIDKLALEVAGFKNVISVPDGAPSPESNMYETKFKYIGNCEERLKDVNKIIIAVDSDAAGRKLEAELIRRLEPERCWRVEWTDGCKDANDVLVKQDVFGLWSCVEASKQVPVEGLFTVEDFSAEIDSLYTDGLKGGTSTGWLTVDTCYTVSAGEVTVVTGIPSHGKSAWLTALIINLASEYRWKFAVFSPENQPMQRFISSIAANFLDKPFREGFTTRMTKGELGKALDWIDEHFVFILPPDDCLTIEHILSKTRVAVTRYGVKGLIIDPWNEVDHSRPSRQAETEYISDCLTKIRRFARKYQVHIWIVAHPTKLYKDNNGKYPVPTPYDISGSAHFRNKADNCITVWRDLMNEEREVELHIQKVRFREVGKVGLVKLCFDVVTGRYSNSVYGN